MIEKFLDKNKREYQVGDLVKIDTEDRFYIVINRKHKQRNKTENFLRMFEILREDYSDGGKYFLNTDKINCKRHEIICNVFNGESERVQKSLNKEVELVKEVIEDVLINEQK